jgi:predicted nucleic acid-binding protein
VPKYVVDTDLYVPATRDDEWSQALEAFFLGFTPDIYLHSVVAFEILAGVTSPDLERRTHERFIRPFERRDRVLTPPTKPGKGPRQG